MPLGLNRITWDKVPGRQEALPRYNYYPLAIPGNSFVALKCTTDIAGVLTGGALLEIELGFSEEDASYIRGRAGRGSPQIQKGRCRTRGRQAFERWI